MSPEAGHGSYSGPIICGCPLGQRQRGGRSRVFYDSTVLRIPDPSLLCSQLVRLSYRLQRRHHNVVAVDGTIPWPCNPGGGSIETFVYPSNSRHISHSYKKGGAFSVTSNTIAGISLLEGTFATRTNWSAGTLFLSVSRPQLRR